MSYNCSKFETKLLDDFRLPIYSLFLCENENWHPDQKQNDDGSVTYRICEATITGAHDADWLIVSSVDLSGEGSGHAWFDVFEPAFKLSRGTLRAIRIWERGDSVDRLVVENGIITEEKIKLE